MMHCGWAAPGARAGGEALNASVRGLQISSPTAARAMSQKDCRHERPFPFLGSPHKASSVACMSVANRSTPLTRVYAEGREEPSDGTVPSTTVNSLRVYVQCTTTGGSGE